MSRSWGHAVRRLTDEEAAAYTRLGWACSTGKCKEPVAHITEYSYVTGRAGRVSWSARKVCTVHGERFAAKHEVEIADAPAPATEAAPAAGTERGASTATEWAEGMAARIVEHHPLHKHRIEGGRVIPATVTELAGIYVNAAPAEGHGVPVKLVSFYADSGWLAWSGDFRWRLLPVDSAAATTAGEGSQ